MKPTEIGSRQAGYDRRDFQSYQKNMKTISKTAKMQSTVLDAKRRGRKIAFVPTMGALHEGHLSLVRKANKLADIVVVSIFVNPTQFGQSEDLSKYPQSLAEDKRCLRELDVDYLFLPDEAEMYPDGYVTYVEAGRITSILEGASRPTHFRGVTTIVAKLFNIVQPDVALFGQKDAQQALVLRRMVKDLNIPVKLIVAPTVREKSGIAMSSRNRYFDGEQLNRAACIFQGLKEARKLIRSGEADCGKIVAAIRKKIRQTKGTEIDYISINDTETLDPIKRVSGRVLISVAVRLDGVRLIDNIVA
ncbi:MAG: pantoate--beta-alanine ligase [Candidatus Zixiibacteriota bacterium]